MTDPVLPEKTYGGILDMLGMSPEKMTALAEGVAVTMLGKMEPVLVAWVNDNVPRTVQSLVDSVTASVGPAVFKWASENAAPAVQSLLDAVQASLPPAPPR